MTVLCDHKHCFFQERDYVCAQSLVLSLPFEGCLLLNSEPLGSGQDGQIRIPPDKLRMGENTLHFRLPDRVLPCEGLYRDQKGVKAMGLPTETLLLSVFLLLQDTQDSLQQLQKRVAQAEKDLKGASLF